MRGAAAALALVALGAPGHAVACSTPLPPDEADWQRLHRIRGEIRRASAVVDGEVVRPMVGGAPALVRAHRVLRGTASPLLWVGDNNGDTCAIRLNVAGERLRMILSHSPDVYVLFRDQSEAETEDLILHSDRRRAWGQEPFGIEHSR